MNQGSAIYCPLCTLSEKRNVVLGSIDAFGNFLIRRVRRNMNNGTTIIAFTSDLYVSCQCGFGTTIVIHKRTPSVHNYITGQLEIE